MLNDVRFCKYTSVIITIKINNIIIIIIIYIIFITRILHKSGIFFKYIILKYGDYLTLFILL